MNCLLDFSLKMQPCRYLDFNQVKLILDSEFQNWNIINVCSFKPLSLWSLIIGAMGKLILELI